MRHKKGECSSICDRKNILAFKGGTHHNGKEDIHLLISLLLSIVSVRDIIENSTSMCYHLNRNCQVLIIKMFGVHSQIRVYIHFMSQSHWSQKVAN